MTMGPLDGVRVIDQTTVVVGPICARTLGDYGADVIKVESPSGDLLRTMAQGSRNVGMSGKFLNFNRNKRSVCLDIKKKEGLRALKTLIQTADVFVSNVRPQGLMRAGLDYEALSADNPRLIYCSIVGFGKGGRYYNRPAYDPIIQSVSGVAATLHRATGEPRFVPMVMTDHTTGLIAAQAIGFALFRREKTGVGEAIEVPMFENMASFVTSEHMGAATFDPPVGPTGDGRLLSPHYRPLPTKDGFITVAPNTDAQAFAFFDAIRRPELKADPRFSSAAARTKHAEEYFQIRIEGLSLKTTSEWLDIFIIPFPLAILIPDCKLPLALRSSRERIIFRALAPTPSCLFLLLSISSKTLRGIRISFLPKAEIDSLSVKIALVSSRYVFFLIVL